MKNFNAYIIGLIYICAGIAHFTNSEFYIQLMPSYFPYHWELVLASGIIEIILGIGVFFKKYRNLCLRGIIIILLIFLSVHFNMLIPKYSLGTPLYLLVIRIIVQFGLIYWTWKSIKPISK